ncbi:MAG: hypothetical protein AAFO95_19560 [Cyanobacteria bacterium J06600_6]
MDYSDYTYRTPEYVKDFMTEPVTNPIFAEAAAKIITTYVRRYPPSSSILIDHVHELAIRRLLAWEHKLKRRIPLDERDYFIKTNLGLVEPNKSYENEVLGWGQVKSH